MTRREAEAAERMSDEAYQGELLVMARYYAAEAAMRDAIAMVNRSSLFAKIDASGFEDCCHDYMPDHDSWAQTIEEAYRG
jgi:hypothetical protein